MPENGKYVVFPLERNKFAIRFENLADKFDNLDDSSQDIEVDLANFAISMLMAANNNFAPEDVSIMFDFKFRETGITFNQDRETIEQRKVAYSWKGEDDAEKAQEFSKFAVSDEGTKITLRPQEIRSFIISVTQVGAQTFLN